MSPDRLRDGAAAARNADTKRRRTCTSATRWNRLTTWTGGVEIKLKSGKTVLRRARDSLHRRAPERPARQGRGLSRQCARRHRGQRPYALLPILRSTPLADVIEVEDYHQQGTDDDSARRALPTSRGASRRITSRASTQPIPARRVRPSPRCLTSRSRARVKTRRRSSSAGWSRARILRASSSRRTITRATIPARCR